LWKGGGGGVCAFIFIIDRSIDTCALGVLLWWAIEEEEEEEKSDKQFHRALQEEKMRQTSGARVAASEFYRSEIHHRNWSDAELSAGERRLVRSDCSNVKQFNPPTNKRKLKGNTEQYNKTTTTTKTRQQDTILL